MCMNLLSLPKQLTKKSSTDSIINSIKIPNPPAKLPESAKVSMELHALSNFVHIWVTCPRDTWESLVIDQKPQGTPFIAKKKGWEYPLKAHSYL